MSHTGPLSISLLPPDRFQHRPPPTMAGARPSKQPTAKPWQRVRLTRPAHVAPNAARGLGPVTPTASRTGAAGVRPEHDLPAPPAPGPAVPPPFSPTPRGMDETLWGTGPTT